QEADPLARLDREVGLVQDGRAAEAHVDVGKCKEWHTWMIKISRRFGKPQESQRGLFDTLLSDRIEYADDNSQFNPRRRNMRFLLKAEMATDAANAAVQNGRLAGTIQSILDDLKPEAA